MRQIECSLNGWEMVVRRLLDRADYRVEVEARLLDEASAWVTRSR